MISLPQADPRSRLVPVLQARLREMAEQLHRIRHLLAGGAEAAALDAAQLQPFVGPEGWPWQAVAAQLTLASPVLRHALRNALVPVVTLGAIELGRLLAGAVLTEQIFSIPGFGKLVVDAVFNRDYPVVQGVVLATALIFVALSLVADILYMLINPRLRAA
jgi:hypothetical protein